MKILLSFALAFLCSCAGLPFEAKAPQDFAPIDPKSVSGAKDEFRALSPQGLMYRVSATPNQPKASLNFWSEAMQKELSSKGYLLVRSERKTVDQHEREIQEWAIPTSGPAQLYWIWFRAGEKHIIYAEAGGSSVILPSLYPELTKAADQIQIKEKDYQP